MHFAELPQPRQGWSFLRAVVTTGKRLASPGDEVRLAISINPSDSTLVYEQQGQIYLEAQAFSGDENLTLIAERDGSELWTEPMVPPESEFAEFVDLPGGLKAPVVQGEIERDADAEQPVYSCEHLAIHEWASGVLPPGALDTSLRSRANGLVVADVGPVSKPVIDFMSIPLSRWNLERQLIENPRTCAFNLTDEGALIPRSEIEELPLGDLTSTFDEFLEARATFFAELAQHQVPSTLSANLASSDAAASYVEAYDQLLGAVPDDQSGRIGYDRLLLVDSILTSSNELLIAPSSPLTVAMHMSLQSKCQEWLKTPPGTNFFANDAELISPRYLVPFLRLSHGVVEWLESGYAPYPWRSYLPVTDRALQERHPSLHRYIAGRIERFLDVHPSYADERRTLKIAFVNGGNGAHIREALLYLLKRRNNSTPLGPVETPTEFAASTAAFSAAAVPMSGCGMPARTAIATADRTTSVRVPARAWPEAISLSIASDASTTTSIASPACTRLAASTPPTDSIATGCPARAS